MYKQPLLSVVIVFFSPAGVFAPISTLGFVGAAPSAAYPDTTVTASLAGVTDKLLADVLMPRLEGSCDVIAAAF